MPPDTRLGALTLALGTRTTLLRATLLSTALLDELTIGFIVIALPVLRDTFGLTYEQAGLLFTAGELSSMVLEPIVNVLSDRGSKRVPIVGGMVGVTVAFALAGTAPSYPVLLLAFALLFPAIGAAVGLSQAALIDQAPKSAERTMTRWTIMAGVGDLLAPLVVAAVLGLGSGWSVLCALGVAAWLSALVLTWPQRFPRLPVAQEPVDGAPRLSTLAALRAALRDRTLLRWVGVLFMATMVDEVFLAFAALYLHDVRHAGTVAISLALAVHMVGGLLGLFALDRLIGRVRGVRLLPLLAVIALVGVVVFLRAPSLWLATVGLFLISLGAGGWYPIAKAAAYATHPDRSGLVRAVTSVSDSAEVALPAVVGLVAGHFGIGVAVLLLGLAPLGVLLLAPRRS